MSVQPVVRRRRPVRPRTLVGLGLLSGVLFVGGCSGGPDHRPAAAPGLRAGAAVAYHPEGSLAGLRLVSAVALTDVVAEDPAGVRTRYVGWDRCAPDCGVTGPYDVETRRLLAQALPGRYPVPAGTHLLVLAVRVDGPAPTGCRDVPALRVTDAAGRTHRLTAPDGGPVVTVCPDG